MARKKKSEPESNGATALLEPPRGLPVDADGNAIVESPPVEQATEAPAVEPSTFTNLDEAQAKYHEEISKSVQPVKTPPSDRERELEEWRNKVVANAEIVEERNKVWKQLAVETKEARESWEQAVSYGQAFIRTMPVHLPLFDKPVQPVASTNGKPEKPRKKDKGKATDEPLPAGDESWRSVSIDTLQLSSGICSKLLDAGLSTIGAITDWTTKGKRLEDIPGVGGASAGVIDAALEKFWADRRAAELQALRAKEAAPPVADEPAPALADVA